MAIHLIEAVQKRLNLPAIRKIKTDDEASVKQQETAALSIAQAALVTVTAALYKLTRTTEGCVRLLLSGKNADWLCQEEAYGSRLPAVIETISQYGIADAAATEHLVREIGDACLLIIHEELSNNINSDTVKDFMSAQRHNILMYLPVDLHLGKILHDSVWDDQTNKMEGPVSDMMHRIENFFS